MPWTKINYPASMKKLPVVVRNKAIQIANTILKENKKMNERILIATSIKHAKDILLKSEKKSKSVAKKKTKIVGEKNVKIPAKKKRKVVAKKKEKTSAKIEAKNKVETPAKSKAKIVAEKKVKTPSKIKAKTVVKKEIKSPTKTEAISPVIEPTLPEIITHGEDLHFIPEHGELHPITTLEAHRDENVFHHREEFAFHQENKKVKEAMATRKNSKKFYRVRGRR